MSFIRQYAKIYEKIFDAKFSWSSSFSASLFFCIIISVMLYYVKTDLVLEILPVAIFVLHLIGVLIDGQARGGMENLISLLAMTPLKTPVIIMTNYVCRAFSAEQFVFYASLTLLFICFKLSIIAILLFFVRTFILLFVVQTIEYLYCLFRDTFLYRFIYPVCVLMISLMLTEFLQLNISLPYTLAAHYNVIYSLLLSASIVTNSVVVGKLLIKQNHGIPKWFINFSNALSRLSLCYMRSKYEKLLLQVQLKCYIRNHQILNKYLILISLTIAYSTIGHVLQSYDSTHTLLTLAYLISIYFFNEIRVPLVLERHSVFDHVAVSPLEQKRAIDGCYLLFHLLFGTIGLVSKFLFMQSSALDFMNSLLLLVCTYYISLYMRIDGQNPSKIHRFKLVAYYGMYCLLSLLLISILNVMLSIILTLSFVLITRRRIYRKEENECLIS